jgi:hypothetical protein
VVARFGHETDHNAEGQQEVMVMTDAQCFI